MNLIYYPPLLAFSKLSITLPRSELWEDALNGGHAFMVIYIRCRCWLLKIVYASLPLRAHLLIHLVEVDGNGVKCVWLVKL